MMMTNAPMHRLTRWLVLLLLAIATTFAACEEDRSYVQKVKDPELLRMVMQNLSDVIVYDIFSPPVASRIYAYPSVAAYEIVAQADPRFVTTAGQFTDFTPIPALPEDPDVIPELAALQACHMVGDSLVFSKDKMMMFAEEFEQTIQSEYGVPNRVWEASYAYAREVANHVITWMNQDNYAQTRTFESFSVDPTQADRWVPTPPDYMAGIEPHWNKIRPFVIDSATQFIPVRPPEFSLDPNSEFYEDLMEVYEVGKELDEEQKEIAQFWDCNPFVTHHRGHVMYATKKITPGGHWVGITKLVTKKANSDFGETAEAYLWTTVSLADAFISCWDEKYRSALIRPETLINQHIDENWFPLLQTPPFPEYTSGHSVISRAAAVALTHLYGDNFSYIDSVEVDFGLPPREFDSFFDASDEAAVSRLYGGIHYMPAIENGVAQGEKVGNFITNHLRTRDQEERMSVNP